MKKRLKSKSGEELQDFLNKLDDQIRGKGNWGDVAAYIPELARVPPDQFAACICTADGRIFSAGDAQTPFSIQSVSKVFSLAIALGRLGHPLWKRVGREPSGNAFDSIVQLELENGRPRNPFINAGAIVTTDAILSGHSPKDTLAEILHFVRSAAGDDDIYINKNVAQSETATGHRNFALAHFLKSYGNLNHDPELTLGVYFHHCAIEMTCIQLAKAGRFLCGGADFASLIKPSSVRSINALMMTCGHYDGSGDFAFRVGIPGKSGVGGGILAIVPNTASIAVWSPGLNQFGNSLQGTLAMEKIARHMSWSVFG